MIGQTDLAWTRDISALGVLGIVLVIIFFVLIPKGFDFYANVVSKKFDTLIDLLSLLKKIALRNYRMLRHSLRHQHDILRQHGIECPHGDDNEDELLDEDDDDGDGS